MLLRFLQKGLTFHNIPLMPGITAEDDENVVYSKQIGTEENNGKARRGPVRSAPGPEEVSRTSLSEALASRHLGPGRGLDSQKELAQTETAPTLAWLALEEE